MSDKTSAYTKSGLPLVAVGVENFIERNYREGGKFQWVREVVHNSLQAGATKVVIGIHWPSVEGQGVYRRMIVDNGVGLSPDDIIRFFKEYGGGGKPIGGEHENFGIGAKSSLLPWNRYGLVIISKTRGSDAAMIRLYYNERNHCYCIETFRTDSGLSEVVQPYVDESGVDWSNLHPLMAEHGTAVILMGNQSDQHTVDNDPSREDNGIRSIARYLNLRYYELPDPLEEVIVLEPNSRTRSEWPRSEKKAHHDVKKGSVFHRRIKGARKMIGTNEDTGAPELEASGTVVLKDEVKVHWYLRKEPLGHSPQFADRAFVASLYQGELYELKTHHTVFNSFGIPYKDVYKRLYLIVEPREYAPGKTGIYCTGDRNRLLLRGGKYAGDPLPMSEWASEFAAHQPSELVAAIKKAANQVSEDDKDYKTRLMDLSVRWNTLRGIPDRLGKDGKPPKRIPNPEKDGGNRDRQEKSPTKPSDRELESGTGARKKASPRGIPDVVWVADEQMSDDGAWMFAEYSSPTEEAPAGIVKLNRNHLVVRNSLEYWTLQYPHVQAEIVAISIRRAYHRLVPKTRRTGGSFH